MSLGTLKNIISKKTSYLKIIYEYTRKTKGVKRTLKEMSGA